MRRNPSSGRPKHSNRDVEKEIGLLESYGWTVIFSEQGQEFILTCQQGKSGDQCLKIRASNTSRDVRYIREGLQIHKRAHGKSYP